MRLLRSAATSLLLLFIIPLCTGSTTTVQTASTQNAQRPASTPYTGDLSIFETPGRDQRLQIDRVMDLLGVKSGSSVADIGAGSGWFTVRAAKRVAPKGIVYAEDINPEADTYMRRRAAREGLANVNVIEGTADNPNLPPDSVDAVLMLKSYHEIANPLRLLHNLRPALRPLAKIGVIDRNGSGSDHGLNKAVLIREMRQSGFYLAASYDFTKADDQDYFLIFTAQI